MTFDASLARLAVLSDEDLRLPGWTFRGRPSELGYALYHALEEEQRAVIDAPRAPTEAARILSLAQSAFGELRGLLAGLDDALLDRAPADGEWSLRETLAHGIGVERSYRTNVEYSLTRTASDPVLMPPERRPQPDAADTSGGVALIVARFAQRRAESDAVLAAVGEAGLARPTMWGGFEVDVCHRLHRLASHIVEHTNQCEKAIRALGAFGGDARAIAKRIGALRGLHERRSGAATLGTLDAGLAEKARLATRA
ncbi:MAG: DinB family protein [Candidatus Limnocylindria bacterium]